MTEDTKKLEQNKHEKPESHMSNVITTGFFGGILWSMIGFVVYYFNFATVGPALVLNPIALGDWKNEALGQAIGILVIAILSIGVAVAYNAVLRKFNHIWVGALFGVVLWGIVFYLLNPIFPGLKSINEIGLNTIVTTICLYVLYGVFIGYSISYDAHEEKVREIRYSN